MDCFNNTCLSCDRECEGHYCSNACKIADVERGFHTSVSTSPRSVKASTGHHRSSSKPWPTTRHHSSYVLESAYNFRTTDAAHDARPLSHRHQSSTAAYHPLHYTGAAASSAADSTERDSQHRNSHESTERSLTPSSSRSSLSSTLSSSSVSYALSQQNSQQLQDYFSSFEKARAAKRRSSLR